MNYPCPCCGYKTLPIPINEAPAYICPVCFWENDIFIQSLDEPSDENHQITLKEARENFKKFGAAEKRFLPDGITTLGVRAPLENEKPAEAPPNPPYCEIKNTESISVSNNQKSNQISAKQSKSFLPEAKNDFIFIEIK